MPKGDARPQLRVEQACRRRGRDVVVDGCVRLLAGGDAEDRDLVVVLGGVPARRLVDDGVPAHQRYWLRVWAARGLLWAGAPTDVDVLRAALRDESWRVREMTCKVAARHDVGDLLDDLAVLETDPVPRVRAAAARAVHRIVAAGA